MRVGIWRKWLGGDDGVVTVSGIGIRSRVAKGRPGVKAPW